MPIRYNPAVTASQQILPHEPQVGGPQQGRPNFTDQLGQRNGPLVGFAVAGGITLAVGDVCMQFSVALLGLSVGPAAINALTIVIGATQSGKLDRLAWAALSWRNTSPGCALPPSCPPCTPSSTSSAVLPSCCA